MSKIVIDLGLVKEPINFSFGLKTYINKKKGFSFVVIGKKKDVSLVDGIDGVQTIAIDKNIDDYASLTDALAEDASSFAVAVKLLKDWDADDLLLIDYDQRTVDALGVVLKRLEFLETPVMCGFIATRLKPVVVADYGYVKDPTFADLTEFYDLALLTAKTINEPKKFVSQKARLIPSFKKDDEVVEGIIAMLDLDVEYGYPWAQDLYRLLQESKRQDFFGTISLEKLFLGESIDALVTCGDTGRVISEAAWGYNKAFLALINSDSSRAPMAGLGLSWARKTIAATKRSMDNESLSKSKLLLGFEKPVVLATTDSTYAVSNALNIALATASKNLQGAIYANYRKYAPAPVPAPTADQVLLDTVARFKKINEDLVRNAGIKK